MWRILGSCLGIVAALFVSKLVLDHWEELRKELKGKNIAVLGPRASGKSTLVKFLLQDELSKEYVATAKPEKLSGKKVKLQDLELIIEDVTDVPGDIQSHPDWERLYREADVVLFLTNAQKLHHGDQDYARIVGSAMRHIGEWFDDRKDNPPQFFLVATHCDQISDYASLPDARRADFRDALWRMPVMQMLIALGRGTKNVKCVAGSLKAREDSERLVGDILRQAVA